jgi:hypothetical protein
MSKIPVGGPIIPLCANGLGKGSREGSGRALSPFILDGCVAAHSCKTHDGAGGKGQTTVTRGNRVLQ